MSGVPTGSSWGASPAEVPPLEVGHAHVWRARIPLAEERMHALRELLTQEERARAARYRFEIGRITAVVSLGFRRHVLGAYVGRDPVALEFASGDHDKPRLSGDAGDAGVHFNVSHSHEVLLLAATRDGELGVDVERERPDVDDARIARRYFSEREVAHLEGLPQSERVAAFFRCWTRKEAYVKAKGAGFTFPLRDFDVSLAPGAPELQAVRSDPAEPERWNFHDLDVGAGYRGALIVPRTVTQVTYFDVA